MKLLDLKPEQSWRSQNEYFDIATSEATKAKFEDAEWSAAFDELGQHLGINYPKLVKNMA